jgi:hypothetical protein
MPKTASGIKSTLLAFLLSPESLLEGNGSQSFHLFGAKAVMLQVPMLSRTSLPI